MAVLTATVRPVMVSLYTPADRIVAGLPPCRSSVRCSAGSYGAAAVTVASVRGGREGISASSAREHSARVHIR